MGGGGSDKSHYAQNLIFFEFKTPSYKILFEEIRFLIRVFSLGVAGAGGEPAAEDSVALLGDFVDGPEAAEGDDATDDAEDKADGGVGGDEEAAEGGDDAGDGEPDAYFQAIIVVAFYH